MELMKLFEERFSVRKFSDKKVEKEKVDLILEAGRLAPTAVDFQPQRIFVLESEKALADLKNCTIFTLTHRLQFLFATTKTKAGNANMMGTIWEKSMQVLSQLT